MKKQLILAACVIMTSGATVAQVANANTYSTPLKTASYSTSNNVLSKLSLNSSDAYVYGNLGTVNYDAGQEMGGVQARIGYQSPLFIGAEVEGSFGLAERDDDILERDFNVNEQALGIKNAFAGFAMGRVPVTRRLNVLARAGYHRSNQNTAFFAANQGCAAVVSGQCIIAGSKDLQAIKSGSASGASKPSSGPTGFSATPTRAPSAVRGEVVEGLAMGMGLEFEISPMNAIRGDFTGYDMGDKYNKSISFGFLRRF